MVAGGSGTYADTAELLHQTETGQWASSWTFGPRLPRALSLARAAPLENRLLLTGGLDAQETYQDSVNQMFKIHLVTHYCRCWNWACKALRKTTGYRWDDLWRKYIFSWIPTNTVQVGSLEESRSAHGIIAGNLSAICGWPSLFALIVHWIVFAVFVLVLSVLVVFKAILFVIIYNLQLVLLEISVPL